MSLSLRRKVFLPAFLIYCSHSSGGGIPKKSKYSLSFPFQQQTRRVPKVPKLTRLIKQGEWFKGLISFREKIPLIGMRRNAHQLIRSVLESGTSRNFIFLRNLPISRRTESVIHDVAVFYREPQPGFDLVLPVRWSIERCVEIEPLIIRLLETAR